MKKQLLFIATFFVSLFISQNSYSTNYTVNTLGNTGFSPSNLTINIGDSVTFVNTGGFHNVNGMISTFPLNPQGFENPLGGVSSGWAFVHVFTIPGIYNYQCDPHIPAMVGVIIVNNSPSISSISYNDPVCFGDTNGNLTVNINQTVPPSYAEIRLFWLNPNNGNWQNSGTQFSIAQLYPTNFSFPSLYSGSYRIDVMNSLGVLIDNAVFTLYDPAVISIESSISNSISCYNSSDGSINLSTIGGTGSYSYSWSNGAITQNLTNISAGQYIATITDINSCSLNDTVIISEPNMLQTSGFVSQSIIGFGNANGEITAQVNGGTPPYNYSINNGVFSTNNLFQNLSASNYLITYEDANSCVISENIILVNPIILGGFATIISPVTCNDACDGSIKFVNNNSGFPPYTYSLNGGPAQASNIFENLCGDSLYYITMMDSQNGNLVDTIYLTQPTSLLFSVSTTNFNGLGVACNGGVGSIYLSNPTGGNGAPISYSFDGGNTFIQSWNQSALQAGTYSVAVKDALGCIAYDNTVLTEPLPITISSQVNDMSCNAVSDGSINIMASGGVLPFSFSWNDGQISQQIVGLSVDTFSCIITDANGCNSDTSVIISEPDVLSATNIIIDNLIPFSNLAAINTNISGGTGVYITTWNGPNNFYSTNSNIDSLFSGVYYLSIQDENLCIFLDTLEIIDPIAVFGCTDSIALNFNAVSNINNGTCYYCPLNYSLVSLAPSSQFNCNGWIWVSIPLGFNPINYFWSTGAPTSDFAIQNLCNDFYSLTIVDDNGCGADTTILLSNYVGCMDSLALNYDPSAMFDDNSCILFIYGCTDSLAANYNVLANTDDSSCVPFVLGCMDTLAINYNALADTIDGTCCYVSGCLDSTMFNYNVNACLDTALGGSCIPKIYGCTDYNAANWNALANTDDGSCWNCNYGCMDSTMFNYDSVATCSQGCIPFVYGCIDTAAFNYDLLANTDDGSCVAVVYGCTDTTMFNYNSLANIDDNNCFSCSFPTSTWLIDTANISSCGASAALIISSINSGPLAYNLDVLWGSFCCTPTQPQSIDLCLGIYSMTVTDVYGCTFIDTIEIGNVVLGCTDSTAQNYIPNANIDDGSCCAASVVDLTLGTWVLEFDWDCPGNDTTYFINYDTNGTWSNSYFGNWELCGTQYTHTYTNDSTIYSGTYNDGMISGTMNDGISSNIGCFSIYLDSSSVILGCIDILALNYDSTAQVDNGNCFYLPGCMDSLYLEYYSQGFIADYDNSSCVSLAVWGCIDSLACNYDSLANVDYGSCDLPNGCGDPLYLEYVSSVTCSDANSCLILIVLGCTDPLATNYDPTATVDDGYCTYAPSTCTSPSPTNAYISELIHDRVRVNWDNMNDANCMVTQYRIRYRELGSTTWSSKTMANSGLCLFGLNTSSKKIVGLTASTTYEYYMKAWYCGGTTSAWSATQNFTTADVCENVINFAVTTPTTTKASFAWDTTAAYSFARIKLRVDTTGGVWTSAGGFGVFYPALSKDKNGLNPGTSYRAQARTWCDPNGGAYRSATWSPLVFWTQPTSIRLEGGSAINNLAVYPNPSRDIFNVSFTSDIQQDLKVRVLNLIGEELINDNLEQFIGEYTKQINLSDNAKGIYFLEIKSDKGIVNKKLILQ